MSWNSSMCHCRAWCWHGRRGEWHLALTWVRAALVSGLTCFLLPKALMGGNNQGAVLPCFLLSPLTIPDLLCNVSCAGVQWLCTWLAKTVCWGIILVEALCSAATLHQHSWQMAQSSHTWAYSSAQSSFKMFQGWVFHYLSISARKLLL